MQRRSKFSPKIRKSVSRRLQIGLVGKVIRSWRRARLCGFSQDLRPGDLQARVRLFQRVPWRKSAHELQPVGGSLRQKARSLRSELRHGPYGHGEVRGTANDDAGKLRRSDSDNR